MGYWSGEADGCDYALTALGRIIYEIKEHLLEDMKEVRDEEYPEQSMIAILSLLRLIGEQFPENLSVHFGRRSFDRVREAFNQWFEKVEKKIPAKHRKMLRQEADKEFLLFEQHLDNFKKGNYGKKKGK